MSAKPIVAIVGRPNVGKSTLFNRIAGRRIAIVEETPGVTRDRIYADCEWESRPFTLIDTGGLQTEAGEVLRQVRDQAQLAIEEAAAILFCVDAKEGLAGLDYEIAEMLRRTGKPVLLVANKVESRTRVENAQEFYALALGDPIGVSALHGMDIDVLLDHLIELLPPPVAVEEDEEVVRIAVVGRPNVGKSSLVNALVGHDRAIVSAEPGTTRDSFDTPCEWEEHKVVLIDTAGIRRKSKVHLSFEYYAVLRAFAAIDRCDVSLLMIDATEGVSDQDQRIGGYAHEQGRAQIIVVNKWDLVQEAALRQRQERDHEPYVLSPRDLEASRQSLTGDAGAPGADSPAEAAAAVQQAAAAARRSREEKLAPTANRTLMRDFARQVKDQLAFMAYAPVVFVSARDSWGLDDLMRTVIAAAEQHAMRVPTPEVSRLLREATQQRPLTIKGKELRVYYATQPRVRPPTFVLFVNDPELMHFSYLRYLENALRHKLGLEGTPLRLVVRESKSDARP